MAHTPTGEGGDNPTIMSVSHTSVDEGGTLTTTVSTLNQDTKTYYLLEGVGITAADFSSGSLMLEGTGNFTFAHTIANDSLTEGTEYLKIQLFRDSERTSLFSTQLVEINDTSTRNSTVTTENGKVIGPTQTQYDTLQGKIPNVKGSGFKGIDAGAETAETRDIFILPNIDIEFLSKTYPPKGDNTGESWYFNTGKTDSNDIFLVDSKVDIKKVAQFANCIWFNPKWEGVPLLDTRRMVEYENYPFWEGDNTFEMAYYSDWERPAPTPSQFGIIDLSEIDLNATQGMSDDEFIATYKSYIKAYVSGSDLDKVTFNASDPTYSVTPSASPINEGAILTTTVATTNVKSGTKLYYSLSGEGINAADFSKGSLTGFGTVAANGKFSFLHTIKSDLDTEGDQTLAIKLFSDSARTIQVGSTASVVIRDTSIAPVTSYTISPSASPINEGAILTTTVATTNVKSGTKLYYSLSGEGINAADFSKGSLTGFGTVAANGKFSFLHTIKSDLDTEGDQTLAIKLFSDSARTIQVGSTASVVIRDTSIAPVTSYTISPSASPINEGAILTTTVATTNVKSGTKLYYSLSGEGINAADFSKGSLTGFGTVAANGKFSFLHTIKSDLDTEGDQTLAIKLFSDSARTIQVGSTASVVIRDTSIAPVFRNIGSLAVRVGSRGVDRITGQGGEIVYGGDNNDILTGLSKISNNGEWIIPSFLSGGLGNDQYNVTQGAFVVVMDAGGGTDTVSAPSMNINYIEFIRINQRDIYATDGNTSVLLVDPQGIQGSQYKLENFVIGTNRYSLAQLTEIANQSDYFGGDYTYTQLQNLGFLNLNEAGMDPLRINAYITDAFYNNSIVA